MGYTDQELIDEMRLAFGIAREAGRGGIQAALERLHELDRYLPLSTRVKFFRAHEAEIREPL